MKCRDPFGKYDIMCGMNGVVLFNRERERMLKAFMYFFVQRIAFNGGIGTAMWQFLIHLVLV